MSGATTTAANSKKKSLHEPQAEAYGERLYQRGGNVTLIGAIALRWFVGAITVEGGTNGDVFITFVEQILVPNLWPGACVVLDNLPAHKLQESEVRLRQRVPSLSIYLPTRRTSTRLKIPGPRLRREPFGFRLRRGLSRTLRSSASFRPELKPKGSPEPSKAQSNAQGISALCRSPKSRCFRPSYQ